MGAMHWDTIVAPITGNPPSAVAWVRLSGPDSWAIASRLFSPWPLPVEPRKALYGRYVFGEDGLALPFAKDRSYTGDETVELSMHGSVVSIRKAIEFCVSHGARMAEPGEFTMRAFLNGRMDLTEAEAVRELIESQTEIQLRQAARNRAGGLKDRVNSLRREAIFLLANVEASVDFGEEIGELDRVSALASVQRISEELATLGEWAKGSRIVRDGYRIVLAGPPNAGKSSLLNRILGSDRAIVSPIPGTTRDYVEEAIELDGLKLVFVDTAGLRESTDEVESIGISRSRDQMAAADEIWFLYDASAPPPEPISFDGPQYVKVIANKVDLLSSADALDGVSATTGVGVRELLSELRTRAMESAPPVSVNQRQSRLFSDAAEIGTTLAQHLASDSPDDLLSVLLQDLIVTLGRVTGDTAEESMIETIFQHFCIGK
jgi:tRNA modification GTPase